MNLRLYRSLGLFLLFSMGRWSAVAQESLTLRQAINEALGQSPEATIARADGLDANAAASQTRLKLLPELGFTEDISRGDDPVYVFGTRLRQRQFTQADFALDALNSPQPIRQFLDALFRSVAGLRFVQDAKRNSPRRPVRRRAPRHPPKLLTSRSCSVLSGLTSQLLYAQRQVAVAQHELETSVALQIVGRRARQCRSCGGIGQDVSSGQCRRAQRRSSYAAQGDLELAGAALREAMGAPELKTTGLKPMEPHSFPQGALEEELAAALKMRPDLKALGQAQSAQASAVGAAKSDLGPRISAYGNWEEDRTSFAGSGGNNWVAGVQISVDILPLAKRTQLARESVAKQKVDAQVVAAEQHLRLQVSQAHIHRKTADFTT